MIGGHIIKPFTFFRVFPHPQPLRSVPGSSLSLFILPPLPPLNRLSIRVPPGISVTLENFSQLPALVIRPWGQGNQEKISIERMALPYKVGECCVSRYVIFPKCRIPGSEKFCHCALLGFTENPHSAPFTDFTTWFYLWM